MTKHGDVHVFPNPLRPGWKLTQGKRTLMTGHSQAHCIQGGIRIAFRDHVDLVIHGRDGRIRSKDSYGNESPAMDTEH